VSPGVSTGDVQRLEPARGWAPLDLGELWRYRHLALLLTRRDLTIRYKQTLLGAAWAIVQPVATMLFFGLFFGRLGRLPTDGLPYPIFYYSALLPWTYVSHVVSNATSVLNDHARIIGRVYFPRVVLPVASILGGLVDLAVAFTVLIALMLWYGLMPSAWLPAVLFFLGLAVLTAVGLGLWLSALNSRFRDIKYGLGFALQFWLFASPVVYPMSLVPARWRLLYALNPMAVVIQGFRWALTGHGFPGTVPIVVSIAGVTLLVVTGLFAFRKAEADMADVL